MGDSTRSLYVGLDVHKNFLGALGSALRTGVGQRLAREPSGGLRQY